VSTRNVTKAEDCEGRVEAEPDVMKLTIYAFPNHRNTIAMSINSPYAMLTLV
jgi:hypothetical protein